MRLQKTSNALQKKTFSVPSTKKFLYKSVHRFLLTDTQTQKKTDSKHDPLHCWGRTFTWKADCDYRVQRDSGGCVSMEKCREPASSTVRQLPLPHRRCCRCCWGCWRRPRCSQNEQPSPASASDTRLFPDSALHTQICCAWPCYQRIVSSPITGSCNERSIRSFLYETAATDIWGAMCPLATETL